MLRAVGGLFLLLFSSQALASLTLDVNLFYSTDTFTYETDSASNRTLWDLAVGMSISRRGQLVLAWNYASSSFVDTNTTDTTLTITDMGPKLIYYFDKNLQWSLGLTYNLITTASYSGASDSELRGTSLKVELGYTPPISETFSAGIKLNYYMPSLSEEVTGSTNLAEVSYSRTAIYPSLALLYRWD